MYQRLNLQNNNILLNFYFTIMRKIRQTKICHDLNSLIKR